MRNWIAAFALAAATGAAQAGEDSACVAAPTRACILTMAVDAIGPVVAQKPPGDANQMLAVWHATQDVIHSAALAGQLDLAMGLVGKFDKGYDGIDVGPLFVAMKLAGRQNETPPAWAEARSFDMWTGPALIAAGRDADFAELVKSRKLSGYDLAGIQIAGNLMAGKADQALAPLQPLQGADRINAGTVALEALLLAERMDLSAPLLPERDLKSVDGINDCAKIAEGTKSKTIAERCVGALNAMPPEMRRNGFVIDSVVPEVVGALAAGGDWEQALALVRAQPQGKAKRATDKLAEYSRAPELLPIVRKPFGQGAAQPGRLLVRMLVLAGQPAEAAAFVATASDGKTRDLWANSQAEALAEAGDAVAAAPVAAAISDPVLRAGALAAIARNLKT